VNAEAFLFTRTQQRDFTAFYRPSGMTNKDVSLLAGALSYINDVTLLTPVFPALYCIGIGEVVLVLRHYDSGRRHAGRPIAVIEGIAVPHARSRLLVESLFTLLTDHSQHLNISATVPNIEALLPNISASLTLDLPDSAPPTVTPPQQAVIAEFIKRQSEERLFLPFTRIGLDLLLAVLCEPAFTPLRLAFGTTSDTVKRLTDHGVPLDVVSYFSTTRPSLRHRANNTLSHNFESYPIADFTPSATVESSRPLSLREQAEAIRTEAATLYDAEETAPSVTLDEEAPMLVDREELLPPREIRRRALELDANAPQASAPNDDNAPTLVDRAVLTPRQMRRRALENVQPAAADPRQSKTYRWWERLVRRLFGD
jgi:hypothetical protein